jgi:hypothetical protein
VGFIANSLKEFECANLVTQHEGIAFTGPKNFLSSLCQSNNRQFVKSKAL